MCMSTAYEVRDGQDVLLCDHVQAAQVENGQVRLVDIIGNEVVVQGAIRTIDLIGNKILIDPA